MARTPDKEYEIEQLYEEIKPNSNLIKFDDIKFDKVCFDKKTVIIGVMLGKIKGYYDNGNVMIDINEINQWIQNEKEESKFFDRTLEEHLYYKYTIVWDGDNLNFLENNGKIPLSVAEDLVSYKGIHRIAFKKAIYNKEINVYDGKVVEKEIELWIKQR